MLCGSTGQPAHHRELPSAQCPWRRVLRSMPRRVERLSGGHGGLYGLSHVFPHADSTGLKGKKKPFFYYIPHIPHLRLRPLSIQLRRSALYGTENVGDQYQ